jgi:transcription elongation GreA/GreB family factor
MRSASGLPPGAVNYITARGAQHLQVELATLRGAGENATRIAELEGILASATVVNPPDAPSNSVAFGATVTVEDTDGKTDTYSVVGVDEVDFERDALSWISPVGKTLLAAKLGDRVKLEDGRSAKIVKIDYHAD